MPSPDWGGSGPGWVRGPRGGGDPPLPEDGYCCGRYASYWNAFLFLKALGMYGWWDDSPLKRAWEYFEFDFELGYEANVLSLLYNIGHETVRLWGEDELYVTGNPSLFYLC